MLKKPNQSSSHPFDRRPEQKKKGATGPRAQRAGKEVPLTWQVARARRSEAIARKRPKRGETASAQRESGAKMIEDLHIGKRNFRIEDCALLIWIDRDRSDVGCVTFVCACS